MQANSRAASRSSRVVNPGAAHQRTRGFLGALGVGEDSGDGLYPEGVTLALHTLGTFDLQVN